MAKQKEYETKKVREWKWKKPDWNAFFTGLGIVYFVYIVCL